MRTPRAYPMLLMLLLLCAGVLGMHTLGHMTPGHAHTYATGPAAVAMTDDCCTSSGGGAQVSGHRPMAPMGDPGSVCLAILTALTLAVVFLLLHVSRTGLDGLRSQLRSAAHPARGPPGRAPVGLLLADLAVLRN